MKTWIALFRGINVGGNNILPMAALREELKELKFEKVRTYIQSGNVVFRSRAKSAASLVKKIEKKVEQEHGFRPKVLLLDHDQLNVAIANNPFPRAQKDPKTLHFFFLADVPDEVDWEAIESVKDKTEKYQLIKQVFYLHAPNGIARSKLAAKVEKLLGVSVTARNYRTVSKLAELTSAD